MSSTTPLSVQLYTVRAALDDDLARTLADVAAIGFGSVELYDFVARAEGYRSALAATGLSAPSAHAKLIGNDVHEIFAAAASLGVTTVIDPRIDAMRWTTQEGIASVADDLNALVDTAAEYELGLGYHNHAEEFETRVGAVSAWEYFADRLDPRIGLELDTYWAAVAGEDPAALLKLRGEQVRFLHIKDGPVTRVNLDQLPVGAGAMNVPAILDAAPGALRVVELDDYAGDVFAALQESFTFLTAEESK